MRRWVHGIAGWFSYRTLKQKVNSLFAVILCAYFLIFILIYNVIIKQGTTSYINETNHNTMLSIGNNLDNTFENASTVSKWIMNSQEVVEYLKGFENSTSAAAYNALSSVYEFTTTTKHISSVYLFKNNGQYINVSNGVTIFDQTAMESEEWYQEIRDAAGGYVIRINGGGVFQPVSGKPVVSFIRIINDLQTQEPIGMLVMNYSSAILSDTYSEMAGGDKAFGYTDRQGRLLCGDKDLADFEPVDVAGSDTFSVKNFGGQRTMYCYPIQGAPLIAVSYEDIELMKYISSQSVAIVIVFVLVTMISLALIQLFITFYITRPVERLIQSMDTVKSGWLKRVSLQLPNDEIGHLKDRYNNMLVEVNRLIEELVKKETAMQQAEMEALQEQIKPHFLYNTLDTIGYLALEKDGEEVYDAIETLGNFYRRFLSKGSRTITISEEIEIIRNYLKLQALRYEDIFADEYKLDDTLMQIKIPKLILQPIVENSLYHGVRLKGEKGLIKLSVYRELERVCISVYDEGVGMSPAQIANLMAKEGKSFGLRKTIERIQTYYDCGDVFEIRSEQGYYCEVIIRIPMIREEGTTDVQSHDY